MPEPTRYIKTRNGLGVGWGIRHSMDPERPGRFFYLSVHKWSLITGIGVFGAFLDAFNLQEKRPGVTDA